MRLLSTMVFAALGSVTLAMVACEPPQPDPSIKSSSSRNRKDAGSTADEETVAPVDASAAAPKGDGGKINKAPCGLASAVEDTSGTVTCKTGTGAPPNKNGGTPLEGTYKLTECSFFDGPVEKPSSKGMIRVTGDVIEYLDDLGYLGGAFQVEGTTLNIYADLCDPPGAAASTPTLSFGFTIDGNDIVRVRDNAGSAIRVLRFKKQ